MSQVLPSRAGRAVLAAFLGAVPVAVASGWIGGTLAEAAGRGGFGALGVALVAAAVGACLGAGLGQLVAFRNEAARPRRRAAMTTSLVALVGFAVLWPLLEPLELDVLSPQLVLATSIIGAALLGRAVAGTRR